MIGIFLRRRIIATMASHWRKCCSRDMTRVHIVGGNSWGKKWGGGGRKFFTWKHSFPVSGSFGQNPRRNQNSQSPPITYFRLFNSTIYRSFHSKLISFCHLLRLLNLSNLSRYLPHLSNHGSIYFPFPFHLSFPSLLSPFPASYSHLLRAINQPIVIFSLFHPPSPSPSSPSFSISIFKILPFPS